MHASTIVLLVVLAAIVKVSLVVVFARRWKRRQLRPAGGAPLDTNRSRSSRKFLDPKWLELPPAI